MTTATTGAQTLLPETELADVMRTLRDTGMVTIPDAFDPATIADLGAAYHRLLDSHPDGRVQSTSGEHHVQMQVPLVPPFSDPGLVAHPIVRQILAAALGETFECSYYNSNTAYPGSTYQPVHRDAGPIFGTEMTSATPATGIVVNVPLCDFTEENGSTEVWPGTHLIVDRPADADKTLDERIAPLASARLNVSAGSAVLRDLRVWHRGVPNRSQAARSMLAIVYKRGWLGWRHPALRVPESTWQAWPEHVRAIFASCPRDPD